jgi:anti-sigma regulatory factor (Ser/Thr protein kinase)
MTSVARPAGPRRLAAFAVPSEPGNERLALAQVAEAVAASGLPPARMERLKTAVAEATMNAIEHGNQGRPDIPVDVEHAPGGTVEEPDLLLKLEGEQRARGWGLFLIRNMVDAMHVRTDGPRHTIQLIMRAGAAAAVPHTGGSEGGGDEEDL